MSCCNKIKKHSFKDSLKANWYLQKLYDGVLSRREEKWLRKFYNITMISSGINIKSEDDFNFCKKSILVNHKLDGTISSTEEKQLAFIFKAQKTMIRELKGMNIFA